MAAPLFSLLPVISSAHNPKPLYPSAAARKVISPLYGPLFASQPKTQSSARPKCLKLSSSKNGVFTVSAASPVEVSQEIVSTSDDGGVSTVISALLLVAFVGLSILTIGVIYIAVTDFLQKRERERFEKEEASKKKKSGKRGNVRARARAGPRGFGEKVPEDDED